MESRVASRLASFDASGAGAAGLPTASLVLLRLLVLTAGCPRTLHLPALPQVRGFEFPRIPLPWLRLMVYRVSSDPAPSGFAVPASSGFPESCIYGWADDDFSVFLELCILGGAADESSNPIGLCTFPSDSGCILNLIRAFRMPASRQAQRQFQPHPASSCRGGTAFPDSLLNLNPSIHHRHCCRPQTSKLKPVLTLSTTRNLSPAA
jgi:hypothetical protein